MLCKGSPPLPISLQILIFISFLWGELRPWACFLRFSGWIGKEGECVLCTIASRHSVLLLNAYISGANIKPGELHLSSSTPFWRADPAMLSWQRELLDAEREVHETGEGGGWGRAHPTPTRFSREAVHHCHPICISV